MTTLIEASDLIVRAGRATILDRVSLAVAPGEIVALVGPNGAGKSTLLRALSGEIRASGGRVAVQGRPIASYSPKSLAERRAMLSQHTTVTFPFSVAEIVRMGASPASAANRIGEAISEIVAQCDIGHLIDQAVTHLSGGEQQRVHLARTLLQLESSPVDRHSRLLFLDEPTASLDLAHQLAVLNIVRMQAAKGSAVVIVMHDLNLASMIATRVVMMRRGKIVVAGLPKDVIGNDVIERVFGVSHAVGIVPGDRTPFVLPQSMQASERSHDG